RHTTPLVPPSCNAGGRAGPRSAATVRPPRNGPIWRQRISPTRAGSYCWARTAGPTPATDMAQSMTTLLRRATVRLPLEGACRGTEAPGVEQARDRHARDAHPTVLAHRQLDHVRRSPEPAGARLQIRGIDARRERGHRDTDLGTDARLRHRAGPEPGPALRGYAIDATCLGQPADAMHLDVPHHRPLERDDLAGDPGIAQRLVETERGLERARQPGVAHELVRRERLLDVEEAGGIEGAQRALVAGPFVRAVGIHRERQVRPRHPRARGPDRDLVPSGRNLDFHTPVAVLQRVVHTTREGVGTAILGDTEGHAAEEARRRRDAQPFRHQLGEPSATAVGL